MVFVVAVVCCLALGLVGRAMAGPERWHTKVRSQIRPEAAEPTVSGFKLLFWWNWLVALIAVTVAVFAIDRIQLTDTELYDASTRAIDVLDGTTDEVTADRIEAEVENLVHADLAVEDVTSTNTEDRNLPNHYEITKETDGDDDPGDERKVCVEVTRIERRQDAGIWYSYTSVSHGKCS